MATQNNQAPKQDLNNLVQEISKIEKELLEKKNLLSQIQQKEVNQIVQDFVSKIEAGGFSKVEVKKLVIEKLTRKHKKK